MKKYKGKKMTNKNTQHMFTNSSFFNKLSNFIVKQHKKISKKLNLEFVIIFWMCFFKDVLFGFFLDIFVIFNRF